MLWGMDGVFETGTDASDCVISGASNFNGVAALFKELFTQLAGFTFYQMI